MSKHINNLAIIIRGKWQDTTIYHHSIINIFCPHVPVYKKGTELLYSKHENAQPWKIQDVQERVFLVCKISTNWVQFSRTRLIMDQLITAYLTEDEIHFITTHYLGFKTSSMDFNYIAMKWKLWIRNKRLNYNFS